MIYLVDPRRLELLLELSRLGSMREVGEAMHVTTSTVSQQIAALAGTVRVAAFASAFRQVLLPVARILAGRQPEVRLHLLEQEPAEALGLLAADEVDLALTYDYNLAPARFGRGLQAEPLASTPWHLGTPSGPGPRGTGVEVFRRYRDDAWIVNSRGTADENVVRIVASLAGFEPLITQRADSLDLVDEMILAGLG